MGDAAGIGPELIVRLAAQGWPYPCVVYGDFGVLKRSAQELGLQDKIALHSIDAAWLAANQPQITSQAVHDLLVINDWAPLPAIPWGELNPMAGMAAYQFLRQAIEHAQAGLLRAIVTAPLNKAALQAAGITQPGHTEILAKLTETRDYAMMLANNELRVILVSIHIALADVPKAINVRAELKAIRLAQLACQQAGIERPRIAVAGLNPHAGEDGAFGDEEARHIAPAIALAQQEGIDASGPWPGDTVFMRARQGEFDIVVAQYHDQGLIPVKYLGLDAGVNVTVGLPFIRTSVDHGTAYDIAGKGIAKPDSLLAAINMALELSAGQGYMPAE